MRKWTLAAATMLLHPLFAPHCGEPEPVVEVVAAEKEVAFGIPIDVEARVRCPENEVITVYPLNYLAKRKVTVKKEGAVKPFFWTGLARGDEETNVTIRDGALVYDLSGIFFVSGFVLHFLRSRCRRPDLRFGAVVARGGEIRI